MSLHKKLLSILVALCLVLAFVPALQTNATEPTPAEAAFDPYVFIWNSPYADQETMLESLPEYYYDYAVRYHCWSPHYICDAPLDGTLPSLAIPTLFNVVNYSELVQDEASAPEGPYASYSAYCSDFRTGAVPSSAYRRLNLEDGYFCYNEEGVYLGVERAHKIRAIMSNTFPVVTDMEKIQEQANAYLLERDGDEAVLVEGLTGAEVLSSSQAAIWHFANDANFLDLYCYTESASDWVESYRESQFKEVLYPEGHVNLMDRATNQTGNNIRSVYEYLIDLPGMEPQDVVLTDDSITLTGLTKQGDDQMTVFFTIDGTINEDDNLSLQASLGGKTKQFSLGASNQLESNEDGAYAVTFEGVDSTDLSADTPVTLCISGTQCVEDICFYEARPERGESARRTSQNFAGHSGGAAPVMSRMVSTIGNLNKTVQITKVDATSGQPLPGVAFDLYADTGNDSILLGSYLTDENGQIRVDTTENAYECYFMERSALPGYDAAQGQFGDGDVIENRWTSGSLTVSKELINSAQAQKGERFTFKLTLDMSTAPLTQNEILWMDADYLMGLPTCKTELDWTAGDDGFTATFTLEADESITIESIPVGTTYTLEELLDAPEDYIVTTLTDSVTEGKGTLVNGTVAQSNSVIFTNTEVEPIPETADYSGVELLVLMLLVTGVLVIKRKFL